ncbi:50S ribosomal protein P1 [Candidatus Parvarchaeota archaeon]|jgi:LSU ribosomal protein L12AE|uniref:50S ribosomal protein P1 n=1 Tax=Candidatus Acidifodinimicrobium mancum TaxID=2898728 RepID=A0A8T3UU39_9ARCH|nr:50S ribosomal protein P1 [Candidatus Acidifodinimicrobium mancum]MBE5728575.1 50S ribosomal protein P1 [Candidatus Acidifodinimicrobium mancum]MBE5728727.1 50S ribosomal protein P1 [Candidatus Acidifodinimicrobium mancum]MBE5729674.1 50S ribosomal protein P1 [Candidatus Acidifodinimicrobium mancum]MBE5730289.1 50S ribosomal protein P1 [Candidatus Acidifodinimicrobium mancum]
MEYVYAAMLLHSLGKEINEDSIKKVIASTGVEPDEGQIKAVVSALKDVDIDKIIKEAQSAPVAAQPAASQETHKEEKKEEPPAVKPEEAAAGLSNLFG